MTAICLYPLVADDLCPIMLPEAFCFDNSERDAADYRNDPEDFDNTFNDDDAGDGFVCRVKRRKSSELIT